MHTTYKFSQITYYSFYPFNSMVPLNKFQVLLKMINVKLRNLEDSYIQIDYDEVDKIPVLSIKTL